MLQAVMSFLVVGAFLLAATTIVGTMAADGRRVLAVLVGGGIRRPVSRLRSERITIRTGRRSLRAPVTRQAWRAAA